MFFDLTIMLIDSCALLPKSTLASRPASASAAAERALRAAAGVWSTREFRGGTETTAYAAPIRSSHAGRSNVKCLLTWTTVRLRPSQNIRACLTLYIADYFLWGPIRQFLLLASRLDMPAPTEIHSQSLSTDFTDPQDRSQTASSVGPGLGVYDDCVIPPSHNARTVVLCFDGTGDQFDGDVCAHSSL